MAWKRPDADAPEPAPYAARASTPTPSASGPPRERAMIGPSITIQGDVAGEEDLTIFGRVEGKVDVKGNSVTIGETGKVKADVYGKTIIVEGKVEGNLYGGDQIVLRSTGTVQGNLTSPRVALEDGSHFKGAIDMEPKRQEGAESRSPKAQERPGASGPGRPGESEGGAAGERSSEAQGAAVKAGG